MKNLDNQEDINLGVNEKLDLSVVCENRIPGGCVINTDCNYKLNLLDCENYVAHNGCDLEY